MDKNLILDDNNGDDFKMDNTLKTLFYSIVKWGKVVVILNFLRMLFLIGQGFYAIVYFQERVIATMPKIKYSYYYSIATGLLYLPGIILFWVFYSKLSRSLESLNNQEFTAAFQAMRLALIWNVAPIILDIVGPFVLQIAYYFF